MNTRPTRTVVQVSGLLILGFLGFIPAAWAGPFGAETKLTASDAAEYDLFGQSVAISGGTAIVGAPGLQPSDDGGGAYLLDVATGTQLANLSRSVVSPFDEFGASVGISGNVAIVGSPHSGSFGSAYLYDVATGDELFRLTATDYYDNDNYGKSVAIGGNIAIVGAPDDDLTRGSVFVFDADPLSPTFGDELLKLTASDGSLSERFGWSVDICENIAVVGAPSNFPDNGSAYLFDLDPFSPTFGDELMKLTASDGMWDDEFGASVAISRSSVIVGAWKDDTATTRDSGSAYLFDADPLSPTFGEELLKVNASDAGSSDGFGTSVDISGHTAIVGASRNNDAGLDSGAAYLFDIDPLSPTFGDEILKLTASDAAMSDRFGDAVAISGSTVLVGASAHNSAGDYSGVVYRFTSTVPEPSSILLAAVALVSLFICRSRSQ